MDHSVVLVSDNEISRAGLVRIISESSFAVLRSARSDDDVACDDLPEDVLFILDLGETSPASALMVRIKELQTSARIVVLAEKFSFQWMMECFRHGAGGFLVKSMNCSQLVASLQLAALGERVMPSELINVLSQNGEPAKLSTLTAKVPGAELSSREMDVLSCLAGGQSNKEIARRLDVSEATVKVHVKAILRKLKVSNRTQAAMWGTENKVVSRGVLQPTYRDGNSDPF